MTQETRATYRGTEQGTRMTDTTAAIARRVPQTVGCVTGQSEVRLLARVEEYLVVITSVRRVPSVLFSGVKRPTLPAHERR